MFNIIIYYVLLRKHLFKQEKKHGYLLILFYHIFLKPFNDNVDNEKPITGTNDDKNTLDTLLIT